MEQCVIGEQFIIKKKIGAGSFGEIYSGENIKTHRRVAVKFEKKDCKIPQLYYESKLYTILQGGPSIPSIYWYGNSGDNNALVIDMLGKSLETLFKQCNSRFSLKTVLMLADQMITCIEYFHQKNFIHRDIKPDNFVMGLGSKSNQVFIIDFGLAKKYRDTWSHQHIQFSSGNSLTGTARYSSLNTLKGSEQSRRDDLEALGYVLLYFLRGDLPWMGKHTHEQDSKYKYITYMKEQISFEDLCVGYPDELVQYFYLVRNLGFAEKPNYSTYKRIFRDLFIKKGYIYDDQYDWIKSDIQDTATLNPQEKCIKSDLPNIPIIKSQNDLPKTSLQCIPPVIEQESIQKQTMKVQHTKSTQPKQSPHKKKDIIPKSVKKIELNEIPVAPVNNISLSKSTDHFKLIENPYFKKKNQSQNQIPNQQNQLALPKNKNQKIHSPQKPPLKLEKNLEYTGKVDSTKSASKT